MGADDDDVGVGDYNEADATAVMCEVVTETRSMTVKTISTIKEEKKIMNEFFYYSNQFLKDS